MIEYFKSIMSEPAVGSEVNEVESADVTKVIDDKDSTEDDSDPELSEGLSNYSTSTDKTSTENESEYTDSSESYGNSTELDDCYYGKKTTCFRPRIYSGIKDKVVYLNFEDYTSTHARLETFVNWPRQMAQSAYKMSKAGFIYAGYGDLVYCYSCHCKLSGWRHSHRPLKRHRCNVYGHCKHLEELERARVANESKCLLKRGNDDCENESVNGPTKRSKSVS